MTGISFLSVSKCLARCGGGIQMLALVITLAVPTQAADAPAGLPAIFRNVSAPAGGTAQLQLFLTNPATLISGSAILDLDPTVFGDILAADVYSADGDQVGTATIQGRHVDLEFSSLTGGIGQLLQLPVFSITVPVLATAAPGAVSALVLKPGQSSWTDVQGYKFTPIASGVFTVSGELSVSSVALLGGELPAGSSVAIQGTGFTDRTNVTIDGVSLRATRYISVQQIEVTLATAADLTFRRVVLQNSEGPPVSFYPVLHGGYLEHSIPDVQPIFPLQLYTDAGFSGFMFSADAVALQNSSLLTAEVKIISSALFPDGIKVIETDIIIPPGSTYMKSGAALGGANPRAGITVTSTVPLRMVRVGASSYSPVSAAAPYATVVNVIQNGFSTQRLAFIASPGAPQPKPQFVTVVGYGTPIPFTVSAQTESGGEWLSASPTQGLACAPNTPSCRYPLMVAVTTASSALPPGTYRGSLTFQPQGVNSKPTVVGVTLTVYEKATLFVDLPTMVDLQTFLTTPTIYDVAVTSSSDPVSFTATGSTSSGRKWLTVTQNQGQTPATLQLTFDPAALVGKSDTGSITIRGPNNGFTIPVSFSTYSFPPPSVNAYPASLLFLAQTSGLAPEPQTISVGATAAPRDVVYNATAVTANGSNWLSVSPPSISDSGFFMVSANSSNLPPGTYTGTITFTVSLGYTPAEVAVTLTVVDHFPPLTSVPSALTFTAPHNQCTVPQTITALAGNIALDVSISTSNEAFWLRAGQSFTNRGTGKVDVQPCAYGLVAGTYHGSVTIRTNVDPSNVITIPVTFTVTPAAQPTPPQNDPPIVTSVRNAASQRQGSIAPGEIVTVLGQNIGLGSAPEATQLLFDGTPAALLYVSSTQINALVPLTVNGPSSVISVRNNGTAIPAGEYPVDATAPGVFTLNGSGEGQATVLNQDSSPNSATNPAGRGSTIQIFATGAGRNPNAVKVTIGGLAARIVFAGSAPQDGNLHRIDAEIPQGIVPGNKVPLVIQIKDAVSQPNVTLAVR